MGTSEELTNRFQELRTSLQALPEVTEPPKSMLRILGSTRSEKEWNKILAYFLDPSQPHGFDANLLKTFLKLARDKADAEVKYYHRDIETVQVDTEATSQQNNRPDIVIRAPEEWFICIESKVEANEGKRQTKKYVEDSHIGRDKKSEYPNDGHHYLFLSQRNTPNAKAENFSDLYWDQLVDAFYNEIRHSYGKYPERSINQLEDFLYTVIQVTNMEEDDFTSVQKEKIRLLSEYRQDIDELLEAADSLHQRALEDWAKMFRSQVSDELWTDEWHLRDDKYGRMFKTGWYLDSNLEPTNTPSEAWGDNGLRVHFVHYIRDEESFRRGELAFKLRSNSLNSVEVRDEFQRLFNSDRWQKELQPILDSSQISNEGKKKELTKKTYDVDQPNLPESYFETLAFAFEEHLPLVEVVDKILDDAVENVQ